MMKIFVKKQGNSLIICSQKYGNNSVSEKTIPMTKSTTMKKETVKIPRTTKKDKKNGVYNLPFIPNNSDTMITTVSHRKSLNLSKRYQST